MPGSTSKLALPYPLGTDPISDGDDQIKALAERLDTPVLAPPWTAPTLTNAWGNHSAGEFAGYRLVAGQLQLRGLIASGAIGSPAFTLPAGFRPAKDTYLATASNNLFGLLIIYATGVVTPAVGNNTWFSLSVPPIGIL